MEGLDPRGNPGAAFFAITTRDDLVLQRASVVANRLLVTYCVDKHGQFRPPVDVHMIADILGAEVRETHLDGKLDAITDKPDTDECPVVYLNHGSTGVRKRFALALELGMIIWHQVNGTQHYETLTEKTHPSPFGGRTRQQWAKHFAAALLMPGHATLQLHVSGLSAEEIAARLHVTSTAVLERLAELGA